jgi:hypothetical protein
MNSLERKCEPRHLTSQPQPLHQWEALEDRDPSLLTFEEQEVRERLLLTQRLKDARRHKAGLEAEVEVEVEGEGEGEDTTGSIFAHHPSVSSSRPIATANSNTDDNGKVNTSTRSTIILDKAALVAAKERLRLLEQQASVQRSQQTAASSNSTSSADVKRPRLSAAALIFGGASILASSTSTSTSTRPSTSTSTLASSSLVSGDANAADLLLSTLDQTSLYAQDGKNAQLSQLLLRMDQYEKFEEAEERMREITSREVTCWHCAQCNKVFAAPNPLCAGLGHQLRPKKRTEWAFRCQCCRNRMFYPKERCLIPCTKCGKTQWQQTSVFQVAEQTDDLPGRTAFVAVEAEIKSLRHG